MNRLEKAVPLELQAFPRWVTWRLVDGKKLPMTVDGKPASVTDCATWATFERVQQASPRGFGGLGFVFTETPFLGIDIDDCLDGGDMERRAMEVVRFCKTYTERSPSGHGLHLIGRGKAIFPGGGSSDGRKKSGGLGFSSFEVYNSRRFFTITGDIVQPFDTIGDLDGRTHGGRPSPSIAALVRQVWGDAPRVERQTARNTVQGATSSPSYCPDDEEVIQRARNARNGEKFRRLFDNGDIRGYCLDHSDADMALCGMLAYWTNGDAAQMERIFSRSALAHRDKWKRADYRHRTIQKAIATLGGRGYRPIY